MQWLWCFSGRSGRGSCIAAGVLLAGSAWAQTSPGCTTQARMTAAQRTEIGQAAYAVATAVQTRDAARVRGLAQPEALGDSAQTEYLVRNTGEHIAGANLQVSQLYLLDASARAKGDTTPAEFNCSLSGTAAETNFLVSGLPAGRFAFATVTASGTEPWLLSLLLEQQGASWRLAGFYPHALSAAGHDGLWYWTTARSEVKANRSWLAWLYYGEADRLLRPAAFVSSTNLEKLRAEQRSAAPQPLANGVSADSALNLQDGGAVYRVVELSTRGSDDGHALELVMHVEAKEPLPAVDEVRARNQRAARAMLQAHPELRPAFARVEVTTEAPGATPVITEETVSNLTAAAP